MSEVKKVEVLIIGAGPAGSVCGSLLKQSGVECTIVDHATFPREKVCAGGLTVKAWRLLDMLLPDIKYDYRPISRMRLQFEDDPVCEFEAEYPIRMTQRKEFDYSLLKLVKNNQEYSLGFDCVELVKDKDGNDTKKLCGYIAKYMSKAYIEDCFFNRNRYYSSQNLNQPKEILIDTENEKDNLKLNSIMENADIIYDNTYKDCFDNDIVFLEIKKK